MNIMNEKVILKSGLRKLKNHKLNIRNTLLIKKIVNEVKDIQNGELRDVSNISWKSEKSTTEPYRGKICDAEKQNIKMKNDSVIVNMNSEPEYEEDKTKEEDKIHLNTCLRNAFLIKKILEITASQMKKGFKTEKFNQYSVTLKKKRNNFRRHQNFYFKIPNRAL